jgi:CheY-specific phosphatase CheX
MFFVETMGESEDSDGAPLAGEPLAGGAPADEIAVSLTFQGEPPGALLLRLTSEAARQISADFLGIDEAEVSALQTSEVIRELANMICGSVLSRVESAAAFHLGAPRIVTASEEIARSISNTRYRVRLSNGQLTVNIGTGIPICPQPAQSAF